MVRTLDGKIATSSNEITLYDNAADITVICDMQDMVYVEWENYPVASFNNANWFMVELANDDMSYFVDVSDMDETTRNALLNYCDGLVSGAISQEGSEIFQSEVD